MSAVHGAAGLEQTTASTPRVAAVKALCDHFGRFTDLDRDILPSAAEPRNGTHKLGASNCSSED